MSERTILHKLWKNFSQTSTSNVMTFLFGIFASAAATVTLLATFGYLKTPPTVVQLEQKKQYLNSQESARAEIANRGLKFSASGFRDAVFTDDAQVVSLYLDGGQSANSYITEGTTFAITGALVNKGHEVEIIDAFMKHGADLKRVNTLQPDIELERNITMGAELLQRALLDKNRSIIDHLIKLGADPRDEISFIRRKCSLIPIGYNQVEQQIRQLGGVDMNGGMRSLQSVVLLIQGRTALLREAGISVPDCSLSRQIKSSLGLQ